MRVAACVRSLVNRRALHGYRVHRQAPEQCTDGMHPATVTSVSQPFAHVNAHVSIGIDARPPGMASRSGSSRLCATADKAMPGRGALQSHFWHQAQLAW